MGEAGGGTWWVGVDLPHIKVGGLGPATRNDDDDELMMEQKV